MKKHKGIMKGVENMVSQTLELKHKKIRQEAARETGLKMLME